MWEAEREVENIVDECMKAKRPGKRERHFIVEKEKEHRLLEGSQASPARPSDKSRVKVNA
jgi:hypothetical protein